ncbi:MAG: PAS domain-containing protein [Deltaproteobacteria bacterium]|nr:PAS domain-containing protein [Deltaproteobacteria bacterium]
MKKDDGLRDKVRELEAELAGCRSEMAVLAEKERLYRSLVESAEDVIFVVDRDGRVKYANPFAARWLGRTGDSIVGRTVPELFPPSVSARQTANLRKVFDTGESLHVTAITALDSRETWLESWLIPSRNGAGEVVAVIGMSRDVTARQRALEEAAKAQRLEALGVLAGGIAHDFNNILSAIMGNISLAKLRLRGDPAALERLDEAERACPRARDLTRHLLTFAKGGAPQKTVVSIRRLLDDSAEFALSGSTCNVAMDIETDLLPAEVDGSQISQVVQNLVINAAQAMPRGGTILVSARNAVVEPGGPLPLAPGRYVEVAVTDFGQGIAPEHLARIFDPYFTTKEHGTGLGLATTYSIIKRHDGHVLAESRPGAGTTFRFFLPATDREPTGSVRTEPQRAMGGGRILFMDDERSLRDVAAEMLRDMGYEVTCARDGAEAACRYAEARKEGRPFAVAILDLTVQGGMGGREAGASILEIDPSARIIVSSGYSEDPIMSEYRSHRFYGAVAKPYGFSDLADVIARVLSKKRH